MSAHRNPQFAARSRYFSCSVATIPCSTEKIPCSLTQGICPQGIEQAEKMTLTFGAGGSIFTQFPVLFPVSREKTGGDRSDQDCLRHHAVLRKSGFLARSE
jgi:hypothetical protein